VRDVLGPTAKFSHTNDQGSVSFTHTFCNFRYPNPCLFCESITFDNVDARHGTISNIETKRPGDTFAGDRTAYLRHVLYIQ
jgi:hypothetical protein